MPEIKQSRIRRKWFYIIPILLAVYVLSIGPVVAIITDSNWNTLYPEFYGFVEAFYTPLGLVANSNDSLKNLVSEYIDFYVQRF
ncbi:hypothetical protein [Gimesia sp.]|uniref:hypothetical protein n=1 Tax=Gimesia sp. TaxID=2024833 RepID=UPI003A8DE388